MINKRFKTTSILSFVTFTFVTFFGSALSSIGTFLAIGRYFEGFSWIAIALCLKTLFGVVFSDKINCLITAVRLKS